MKEALAGHAQPGLAIIKKHKAELLAYSVRVSIEANTFFSAVDLTEVLPLNG
jgi:hypothetical protein